MKVKIRDNGFKLTRPRELVLEVLDNSKQPLTLNEIHLKINDIDFASVYRNIKLFKSLELVSEVLYGDKTPRYELKEKVHRHHVVCARCGKVKKVDICLIDTVEKNTGFKIIDHSVVMRGICPDCL
ncbi:MAG: transcriptional repressor [Melioribacteraceae bacterium]|nr:transcriptional repressor [Melioribacteraceae bacterium]MCO6474615.1 transcriptional repressor [Melioribacteraceae bacterium]MDD3557604.1 Fur family transcriptional regulator [Melioribacteraceae bacterium]